MTTENSGTDQSIEPRTLKAATESMTVSSVGDGRFGVYNADGKRYEVNLVTGACTCPDAVHHSPEEGCKHLRRAEMEAGTRDVPDLDRETDVELMIGIRDRRFNGETEHVTDGPEQDVATDGGAVVAPEPQGSVDGTTHAPGCSDGECEGLDADAERPILSFECWEQWAAYDEEQLIEEAHQ